jgi:hypothetical protein
VHRMANKFMKFNFFLKFEFDVFSFLSLHGAQAARVN